MKEREIKSEKERKKERERERESFEREHVDCRKRARGDTCGDQKRGDAESMSQRTITVVSQSPPGQSPRDKKYTEREC